MTVSILILTFNEEKNITDCIRSVNWSDDIHVFDCYSTDETVRLAKHNGAHIHQHKFVNYGKQREAARTLIPYKYDWVLSLDADERADNELSREISHLTTMSASKHSAYRMRRKDYFMNTWIKNSTLYPSWFVRLFRHAEIYYPERSVHEYPTVNGSTGELQGHLLHYSFQKGLSDWFAKHNKYAELEAVEAIKDLEKGGITLESLSQLKDPVKRRQLLKRISYRLPMRPVMRFLYMYIFRKGWMDGQLGLTYCTMLAFYEFLIVLKIKEQKIGAAHTTT